MKRCFLLLVLFVVTGCVVVPYAPTVIDKCKAQYFNQYYGNCIFQTYDTHPNGQAYIKKYNYRADWMKLAQTNSNIINALENGATSINEANELFMREFNNLYQKDVQRVEQQNQSLRDLSASLQSANNALYPSGSNNTLNQNNTSFQATKWYSFDREEINGKFKTCYFVHGFVSVVTTTVLATQNCPVGVRQ